ncbi:MAG: conjugal transfer protein TraN [Candidatus Thorarchaeota archaeon]|nr:MAG: conjugal transfer protein TraN [Candidatus Thorarchaeota archaeon]
MFNRFSLTFSTGIKQFCQKKLTGSRNCCLDSALGNYVSLALS